MKVALNLLQRIFSNFAADLLVPQLLFQKLNYFRMQTHSFTLLKNITDNSRGVNPIKNLEIYLKKKNVFFIANDFTHLLCRRIGQKFHPSFPFFVIFECCKRVSFPYHGKSVMLRVITESDNKNSFKQLKHDF